MAFSLWKDLAGSRWSGWQQAPRVLWLGWEEVEAEVSVSAQR